MIKERAGDVNLILMTLSESPTANLWPNWEGNAWMPVDWKVNKKFAAFPFLEMSGNTSKFSWQPAMENISHWVDIGAKAVKKLH